MTRTTSEADKNHFRAEDCLNPEFYIDGALTGGVLCFEVVAVVGGHRGQFTGRQFFDALMRHMGRRRVKVISSLWTDARPDRTTNLDIFNRETKKRAAMGSGDEKQEEAAFATHTGRWARDYHFTVAQNIDSRPIGTPG